MAQVSTYLNFNGTTEAAFNFYKSVFGTEFSGIMRLGDVPAQPGQPAMSEADKRLIMNIQLPILGGHQLMGTDTTESMGFTVKQGNNVLICLNPDTRSQADELFTALSASGTVDTELQEMFWGDYYGSLTDQFGILWMINCTSKS